MDDRVHNMSHLHTIVSNTVDSSYNKLLEPSEITLLYIEILFFFRLAKTIKLEEILKFGTKIIT